MCVGCALPARLGHAGITTSDAIKKLAWHAAVVVAVAVAVAAAVLMMVVTAMGLVVLVVLAVGGHGDNGVREVTGVKMAFDNTR